MASEDPKKSSEKFMNKSERQKCWGARDKYWACLDAVGAQVEKDHVVPEQCLAQRQVYQTECPPTWVKHFDRKYHFEKVKEKLMTDGFSEAKDKEFMEKDKLSQ